MLKDLENKEAPASDFLFALFEKDVTDTATDPSETAALLDRSEFLVSLEFAHLHLQQMEDSRDAFDEWQAATCGDRGLPTGRRSRN